MKKRIVELLKKKKIAAGLTAVVLAVAVGGVAVVQQNQIPELPSYPVTLVLAFLNSTVFQYIFMKKYATHKVLRGDLEELPFPLLPAGKIAELAQMAESVVKNGQAFAGLNLEICHLFHLNANDLKYICHELEKGNARRQ